MKYYAGLDVSQKETFVCVMDQEGKIIQEQSITTKPKEIFKFLSSLEITYTRIGLESGSLCHWLTDELLQYDLPVKCIDARHIASILSVKFNKTDKNDARGIADAMRCNLFKEVALKGREQLSLGTLLNCRKQLVDTRVQLIGTIRGSFKPYGVCLNSLSKGLNCIDAIRSELNEIPEIARIGVEGILNALEEVILSIKYLDKQVRAQVKHEKKAELLTTVPGVGAITALRFLAEIGDPKRFRHSRSVGAYVGMTPKQYSSGETHKQGRISKCGPRELRSLLMEAGHVILTRTKSWSKLKAWGIKLHSRKGIKKAAVAVGRKLAVIMHKMLLEGTEFKYTDKIVMENAA